MECLTVALKELKIPLKEETQVTSLKCSGDLQHIGYCHRDVLYVYHVLQNNGKVQAVQHNASEFVWWTVDTGSGAHLMESQHMIVASSNHDITWYKVTTVSKETVQVSSVCSMTAAHLSSVSMKGGKIDTLSLHTSLQDDHLLVLINGHVLCQLNINLNRDQLDITICCDLTEDISFIEAILGIQHSSSFYKLLYRRPLLLAVTSDHSTLVVYNIINTVSKNVGAVNMKTVIKQNPGSVMPLCTHHINCFDLASDLDTIVICLGLSVLVFKLSTYFILNKEHLNPRFVHELADRLVVRQCHGQGISYEEEEDEIDYGMRDTISSRSSWHKRSMKLLHMIDREQVATATKGTYNSSSVKWYEDPSILYEEHTVSNHGIPVITGLSSSSDPVTVQMNSSLLANVNNSYVLTILPMASQKVAKENSDKVVAMVMLTPSTVVVYYGGIGSVTAVREDTGVTVTNVIVCALDSKEYSKCKISEGSIFLGVANPSIPIAMLSHSSLVVPILGLSHQEFVQKVLIYESAVAAEIVCRLNQWDRCFLPINALETALELRQLDTVNFFLNPKESAAPDDEATLPVALLDKAIDLLIRAIKKNLTEHKNSQFSSQLLNMTIAFVNNLMKESVKDAESSPPLEELSLYMLQLRECLVDVPKHSLDLDQCNDLTSSLTDFGLSRKNAAMWSDLSREEVLKDALLKGCLPEAQYYFISNGTAPPVATSPQISVEDSLLEAATMTTATIATGDFTVTSVLSAGVGYVIEALMSGDIPLACNLLAQMGLSIKESLRYLCFNTFSKQLRTTIVEELRERDWLSMNELEALEYLQLLELLYPVRSFEAVKSFHFKNKILNYQSTNLPELNTIDIKLSHIPTIGNLEDLYPETFGGDYSIPLTNIVAEKSNGGYLHVCLQLILTWDHCTRERLLLEGNQLKSTAPTNQQLSWGNKIQYYCSHNSVPQLLHNVTELLVAISNGSESSYQLTQLNNHFAVMTSYSNNFIRDELARQGIILADEAKDFNTMMYRIGRTHCLLSQQHPLAHMSQLDINAVGYSTFHSTFIDYCVKNNFVSLLYHYLDTYNLAVADGNSSEEIDSELIAQHCWLDVMLKFRGVAQRPLDPNAMFMASLSSSRLLLGQQGGTIMGMLSSGHPLIAMAMLMYSNIGLQEAMEVSNEGQDWYVDWTALKASLAAYPKLQDAIFPLLPSNCMTVKTQDITVYKLLQGNVSFNVARLFQWQSTNTLTREGDYLRGAGGNTEMPHFSLQSLATVVTPHQQYLTYQYHLLQGQPAFAYANFIAAKKRLGRNFNKEINRGVNKAYMLAMNDFTNISLTSSCIIFTELLSQDSTKLRVHLSTARRLLKYCDEFANDAESISHQFFEMKSNPSCAQQVLTQLEVATTTLVDTMEIELCSVEALECWQLIGSFCQLHGLVASKRFLITCAEQGKWLSMLCHAQQLHLPPDELLLVIEHHYVESRIKEHLMLAIGASTCGAELPLSPRSYHNAVMEQQRSHKGVAEKTKPSSKVKRQLNVRARFYSKMGLPMEAKSSTTEVDHVTSHDTAGTQQTDVAMVTTDECDWQNELTPDDLPTELFAVLFKCHQSPNCCQLMLAHAIALRQPLLAIFAGCCEGANVIACMCTWLCMSVDQHVVEKFVQLLNVIPASQGNKKPEFTKELQWRRWGLLDLAVMIAVAIQHKMTSSALFKLLFKYFDPQNVLIKFMMFYENFKFRADHIEAMKCLQQFENDLENESVTGAVGDQQWTEDIANFATAQLLVNCCASSERIQLLKILSDSNFASKFHHKTIDYSHLHQINSTLSQTDLCWDLSFTATLQFVTPPANGNAQLSLQDFYSVKVRVDSEHVIEALMDKKEFVVAHTYARIVGADGDQISVREVQHKLDMIKFSELWKEEDTRIEFWLSTNQAFQQKTVSPDLAANFFEGTVQNMTTALPHYLTTMEQVLLLSLALQWHKKARQIGSKELQQREKEIWLSHIKCIAKANTDPQKLSWLRNTEGKTVSTLMPSSTLRLVELIDWSLLALLDHHGPCALKELMTESDNNIDIGTKSQSLNKEEVDALEIVLGRLLNAGRVKQAVTLSNLFEHGSPNLASVLCCIQLAQGKLSPDQLTPGVIKLLSTNLSTRSVAHSSSLQGGPLTSKSQEVIQLMELLADRAPHAHHCCAIIIHCFRIALAIRHPYESIVSSDPLDTLTGLLNCNQVDRISLAENFVQVCQLSAEEIADYLCDCVTFALMQYQSLTHTSLAQQSLMASALARTNSRLTVYDPRMTSNAFMELVQLCPDPAMLGYKLFAMINSSDLTSLGLQAKLSVQVDLLIRAHDCFSIGCNIDGITTVLELAHKLSDTLNNEKEFKLMVRLLTGIRRFREMGYIIDILVCNNEFETLLSKNVEKEEQFKTALLDYLKKYHSTDTEKLRMVAGKFLMHREQAKAIEEQARSLVRSLKRKKLDASNPEIVKTLKNGYNYYQDAAAHYAQDDCLTNTEHCMSQARLVALQLSIMKNDVKVINLDNKAVMRLLQEHHTFYEALIVADAYKSRVPIEWSVMLYHRVILAGDFRYYNDYKCALPLTVSLFQELASKYRRDQQKTQQSAHNMRQILNDLPDLSLRHRLLHELGYGYHTSDQPIFNPEEFIHDIARL